MITKEQLKNNGYKYFGQGFMASYADYFMQKKFVDEKGEKYFINFLHYSATGESPEEWMAELTNNEPHYTFQIHRPDSIEKVEQLIELFWKTMSCEYYELYETPAGSSSETVQTSGSDDSALPLH